MLILFNNCSLLDTAGGVVLPDRHVLIEDGIIREVSDSPLKAPASAIVFDLAGKTLMPGLCDAHVHVTAVAPDFVRLERMAPSYIAISASKVLRGMIMRGFTTVRDAGGADWGLAEAVREGLCEGPRILFSGHALSQTGGHGDMRSGGEDRIYPFNPPLGTLGRICDGVTEVRRAARDELRKGAHQIKVMASGGVASPTDPVENTQFSLDEMRAIVEEAEAANTYVMAHAYNDRSIRRALECGVRSIEHGNLIEDETLKVLKKKKAFLVPTLSVYEVITREAGKGEMPAEAATKVGNLREMSLRSLESACRSGVSIAYGTDLYGSFHRYQSLEFSLRREIMPAADVIRCATTVCADLFNMTGKIGVITPGALADLLVIDGNPLDDLGLLQDDGKHMDVIMKQGRFVVNRLEAR